MLRGYDTQQRALVTIGSRRGASFNCGCTTADPVESVRQAVRSQRLPPQGASPGCPIQLGAAEICPLKVAAIEVGPLQVGAGEVGLL